MRRHCNHCNKTQCKGSSILIKRSKEIRRRMIIKLLFLICKAYPLKNKTKKINKVKPGLMNSSIILDLAVYKNPENQEKKLQFFWKKSIAI